jgi:excisionase family DNA binding protein
VSDRHQLQVGLPDEMLDEIARRCATIVIARLRASGFAAEQIDPTPSEYLTVADVGAVLRCSRSRVHNLVSRGSLPRYRDGGRLLIRRADLDRYLDSR